MNIGKMCAASMFALAVALSGQPASHAASGVSEIVPFVTDAVVDFCGDFDMRVQESGTLNLVRSRSNTTLINWRVQISAQNLSTGKTVYGRELGPLVEVTGDGGTTVVFLVPNHQNLFDLSKENRRDQAKVFESAGMTCSSRKLRAMAETLRPKSDR